MMTESVPPDSRVVPEPPRQEVRPGRLRVLARSSCTGRSDAARSRSSCSRRCSCSPRRRAPRGMLAATRRARERADEPVLPGPLADRVPEPAGHRAAALDPGPGEGGRVAERRRGAAARAVTASSSGRRRAPRAGASGPISCPASRCSRGACSCSASCARPARALAAAPASAASVDPELRASRSSESSARREDLHASRRPRRDGPLRRRPRAQGRSRASRRTARSTS